MYSVLSGSIASLSAELSRVQNIFGVLSRASATLARDAYAIELSLFRGVGQLGLGETLRWRV